jgi:large subunit ribosomal protein L22
MKAVLRGIRITPKKANLVAGMVRGKPVNEALAILKFTPKKGARILAKVIKSAAANAKTNFGLSMDDLKIDEIWCVKGPTLKRATPANRGRMWPIHEVMSHITVTVTSISGATPKKVAPKVVKSSSSKVSETSTEAKTAKPEKAAKTEPVAVKKVEKKEKPAKKIVKKEAK